MADSEKLDKLLEAFDAVNRRLSAIESRLNDLQFDGKIAKKDIKREIYTLRDEVDTIIDVMRIHKIARI